MLRIGPAMGRCLVSELEIEAGDEETHMRATQRQDTGGDVLGDRPSGEMRVMCSRNVEGRVPHGHLGAGIS